MLKSIPARVLFASAILHATFCGLPVHSAQAFGLSDHKRITLQAIEELNQCYPGLIGLGARFTLWTSNLDEDLNPVRKALLYAHYYSPEHILELRRLDSRARILDLQNDLTVAGSRRQSPDLGMATDLGHAIHHIQDMASPPHVAPVAHGLSDGFESWDAPIDLAHGKYSDLASGLSCAELGADIAVGVDLETLHGETARETLAQIRSERVEYKTRQPGSDSLGNVTYVGATAPLSEAFWVPTTNADFGRYGSLGNHFGETNFQQGAQAFEVQPEFYAQFKQRQLRLAVRSTLRAIAGVWLRAQIQ